MGEPFTESEGLGVKGLHVWLLQIEYFDSSPNSPPSGVVENKRDDTWATVLLTQCQGRECQSTLSVVNCLLDGVVPEGGRWVSRPPARVLGP